MCHATCTYNVYMYTGQTPRPLLMALQAIISNIMSLWIIMMMPLRNALAHICRQLQILALYANGLSTMYLYDMHGRWAFAMPTSFQIACLAAQISNSASQVLTTMCMTICGHSGKDSAKLRSKSRSLVQLLSSFSAAADAKFLLQLSCEHSAA